MNYKVFAFHTTHSNCPKQRNCKIWQRLAAVSNRIALKYWLTNPLAIMIEVKYFPLGGGQRRFSKRERVLKTHRVFIFPKTWFPYSCICRICRVKLAPCSVNTTRCNSYDSFKSILGFHIVSCICRIGRTKCILGHIFVVSIVWVTCDKYNYMETRFKRYSIIIKIIKIQSCCFKSIEKFPGYNKTMSRLR